MQFKAMLQSAAGRITGDTDVLEGMLAIGIAVAMADGVLGKKEVEAVVTSANGNPLVQRLFSTDVVGQTKDKFLAKLRASPNMETAFKELRDLAGREESIRHAVYAGGCSVAAADGSVDAKEQKLLDKCADILNITAEDKKEIEAGALAGRIVIDF
jgi:tellurite resistance protein